MDIIADVEINCGRERERICGQEQVNNRIRHGGFVARLLFVESIHAAVTLKVKGKWQSVE